MKIHNNNKKGREKKETRSQRFLENFQKVAVVVVLHFPVAHRFYGGALQYTAATFLPLIHVLDS